MEQRVAMIEKEMAELKRQLGEQSKEITVQTCSVKDFKKCLQFEASTSEKLMVLTEKQAFCVAKHLQAFLQLTVNEDQFFILPCRVCKYVLENPCGIDRFELMNLISEQTGVALSFWKGFKTETLPEDLQR